MIPFVLGAIAASRRKRPSAPAPAAASSLEQDWANRMNGANTVQAIRFASATPVTTYTHPNGYEANVQWDTTDGVIGDGCLKIDVPPGETSCAAEWHAPLNSAWTTDYQGFAGSQFYMFFMCKLGPNRMTPSTDGGGFKVMNLAEHRISSPALSFSNTSNEVVINNQNWRGSPFVYRNPAYQGLDEVIGGDIRLQPARDLGAGVTPNTSRYCIYPGSAGCWDWPVGEWFALQLRLKAPNEGGSTGNEFDLWAMKASDSGWQQLFASRNFFYGPDLDVCPLGVNGVHFLAYDTGRTGATYWTNQKYDQLAVSTSMFPAPYFKPLPSWVPAVGTWVSLAGTNLSSVPPATTPAGATGPSSKIVAWTSFAAHPRTNEVFSAANGGHADYSGNEANRWRFDQDVPDIAEVRAPAASVSDADYYADGTPSAVHSYYGMTINVTDNRVMIVGGSRYASGAVSTKLNSYNIGAATYNAAGTHPDLPASVSGQEVKAVCRDPRNDNIYVFANYNVAKWTRSSNTWSSPVSNQTGPFTDHAASAFDTLRNRIFLLGGQTSPHHTYDVAGNTFTSQTMSGTDLTGTYAQGMVYVEELDAYFVRQAGAGGTVYKINAATFAVTTFSTTGGGSIPATTNGPYNKFLALPRLRGIVYFPSYTGDAWFLRTH